MAAVGSNQYQSKGESAPVRRPTLKEIADSVNATLDNAEEEIAWAFGDESAEWATAGIDYRGYLDWWVVHGFHAEEAAEYLRWGIGPDAADDWLVVGVSSPSEVAEMRGRGVTPDGYATGER